MKTNIHFWSYLAEFFLEWKMFQTIAVEKIKTYFMVNNVFRKSFHLWYNAQICCNARQATDDNMVHEHCMWYN